MRVSHMDVANVSVGEGLNKAVIPAKAGIHFALKMGINMDSGFRRNDGKGLVQTFLRRMRVVRCKRASPSLRAPTSPAGGGNELFGDKQF